MRSYCALLVFLPLLVSTAAQDIQLPDNEIVDPMTWFLSGESSGDWSCQCSKEVSQPCPKDVDCSAIQCEEPLAVSCSQIWYFGGGGGSAADTPSPPPVSRGGSGEPDVWHCGCTYSAEEASPCPPDASCPEVACDAGTYPMCYPSSWVYRGGVKDPSAGSSGGVSSGGSGSDGQWTCGCSSDPKAEKLCYDIPDCQVVLASTSCSTSAPYVVCEQQFDDVPPPEGNTWTCGCSSDPKAEKQCPDDPECQYVLASTSCLTSAPYVVCEQATEEVPPPEGNTWTCGCSSDPKAEKQCPDDPDCQYVLASTSCLTSSPYVVCEQKTDDVPPPTGNTWTCGCSSDPKAEKQCPDDPDCQYVLASTSCLTSAPYVVCEQDGGTTGPKDPVWVCDCTSKASEAQPCPRDDPNCPLLKCPGTSPYVHCEQRWYLDDGAAGGASLSPPRRRKPPPKSSSPPAPKRSTRPAPKAAPKPAAKPMPKPAAKPHPACKPTPKVAPAKPLPKAAPKPAGKPAPKAGARPAPKARQPKPAAKPSPKLHPKPAAKPMPKPAAKPMPSHSVRPRPMPKLSAKPMSKPNPKTARPSPKAASPKPMAKPAPRRNRKLYTLIASDV